MFVNTDNYSLSKVLVVAQRITSLFSSWSEDRVAQWTATYPGSVNIIVGNYGYNLFTHPEYASATAEEQQAVRDVFKLELQAIGKYVDAELLGCYLTSLTMQGDVEYAALLVECLGDKGQMLVGSHTFGQVIENIFHAPQHNPEVTQQEVAMQMRGVLEDLADHPNADIAQLVDVQALATTMWDAGFYGQLGVIDAIIDNLSDDAQVLIDPNVFGEVVRGIFYAPQYNPEVTQEETSSLIREILEGLADHPYADIAQLVNVNTLATTMVDASMTGHLDVVDAIMDNLSNDAQASIDPHVFGEVIEGIFHTPQYNPEVAQEAAVSLIREIMEDLADHPYADIAQLVNVNILAATMFDASMTGHVDVVDAIADNLSDDAQTVVGTHTFGEVIKGIFYAPQYNPEVTQEEASSLICEIMEDLADHSYADIAQLVDVTTLAGVMLESSIYGELAIVDAIADNLSDDAQAMVGMQTFGEVIRGIFYAPQHNPEVTLGEAAALIREIMEDLADHPHMDIAQLVDVQALAITMLDASIIGQMEVVDAIADNLSDDAQAMVGIQAFGEVIRGIFYAPQYNPEVTLEDASASIRKIMKNLAGHPYMDIAQLVDVQALEQVVEGAAIGKDFGIVDDVLVETEGNTSLFGSDGDYCVYSFGSDGQWCQPAQEVAFIYGAR